MKRLVTTASSQWPSASRRERARADRGDAGRAAGRRRPPGADPEGRDRARPRVESPNGARDRPRRGRGRSPDAGEEQSAAAPGGRTCASRSRSSARRRSASGLPRHPEPHRAVQRVRCPRVSCRRRSSTSACVRPRVRERLAHGEQHSLQNERELVMLAVAKLYLDALASASRVDAARAQVTTAEALSHSPTIKKPTASSPASTRSVSRSNCSRLASGSSPLRTPRPRTNSCSRAPSASPRTRRSIWPTTCGRRAPVPSLEAATAAAMTHGRIEERGARVEAAEADRTAAVTGRLPSLHFDGDYGGIGNTPGSSVSTYYGRGDPARADLRGR